MPDNPVLPLADAKAFLNKTGDGDDVELASFIDAAVEQVAAIRREVLAPTEVTGTYAVTGGVLLLDKVPVLEVLTVEAADGTVTWDVAELDVEAEIGRVSAAAGPRLRGRVRVTYRPGRETFPAAYVMAAKMILGHLWRTQRTPFGTGAARSRYGGVDGDDGTEMVAGWAIPRAALELLGPPAPGVG